MEDATSAAEQNTCMGQVAGFNLQSDNNTFLGYSAGSTVTTGADNVAVGSQTMDTATTGTGSIAIGKAAL